MTDRPIDMRLPQVRALLDGRKTQDRRVLKPQPEGIAGAERFAASSWKITPESNRCAVDFKAPVYAPGDRLYVREAWRVGAWDWNNAEVAVDYCDGPRKQWLAVEDGDMLHRLIDQSRVDAKNANRPLRDSYYEYSWLPGDSPCRWRPSIHMPRWASRLTLTVTDVRVQRLQDISEADAVAEGCDAALALTMTRPNGAHPGNPGECYRDLWNSLHGADAWDANPWVVALTFKVQRGNIDQVQP